jgi:hypothetical protein
LLRIIENRPTHDVAALENIRRANLHLLTSRKGSKVQLAKVMDISDSNMANRLYGQKRMDDAEANRFTERLGLPTGWLDVPRSVTNIPELVSDLLVPPSRHHATAQQELPPAIEHKATSAKKPAGAKEKTTGARGALPPDADSTDRPTGALAETNTVMGQRNQAVPTAAEPAIAQPVDNDVSFSTAGQQLAPASVTHVITESRRLTSATSLDDLLGIKPIAEALIKTLAGKARTGRLDEIKALELLQQAVLL